jgi:hypothetical protein
MPPMRLNPQLEVMLTVLLPLVRLLSRVNPRRRRHLHEFLDGIMIAIYLFA